MDGIIEIVSIALRNVGIYVTILFFIALILRRNDIADIAWGPGIFLVAYTGYQAIEEPSITATLITFVIGIWALRLGFRIGRRNLSKKEEDSRYRAWRDAWGSSFYVRSFFQIFIFQGILMVLMGYPLLHLSVFDSNIFSFVSILGLVVWLCGFLFESIADMQLDRFVSDKNNKGKILDTGLWKYSRHPNYFGEVLLWWGIWIAMILTPYGIAAIISPLLITLLILKVSGVPMLEKILEKNPAFAEYKKNTSIFFPLPPRKK